MSSEEASPPSSSTHPHADHSSPSSLPPEHPSPTESLFWDNGWLGYGFAGLLIANGIMTGLNLRGGMKGWVKAATMFETGLLPSGYAAFAANRQSLSPPKHIDSGICSGLITTHYACLAYMKRPSFLPAPLLGFVSLAVTGIFSYRQLDELEKEAKLKQDESNDFYDNMIKKLLYEDEKKA